MLNHAAAHCKANRLCAPLPQFYAIEGDVMGSTAWCLSILAGLTLVFAACGACALSGIRHDAR